jgi:TorA maturation chaperone TorD
MNHSQEELESALAARHYLYSVFQRLLGAEPNAEMLSAIDASLLREAFSIVGVSGVNDGEPSTEAINGGKPSTEAVNDGEPLVEAIARAAQDPKALKTEYTNLFIGPGKLPAPPWESVYVSKESVLFTRTTLEVRNFYRSQGLIPELYPKVADDHIALDLDFLRLLAERALESFQADEDAVGREESNLNSEASRPNASYCEALTASREFLDEHLLKWLDRFVSDLKASEKGVFYPQVAQALIRFVERDADFLGRHV